MLVNLIKCHLDQCWIKYIFDIILICISFTHMDKQQFEKRKSNTKYPFSTK